MNSGTSGIPWFSRTGERVTLSRCSAEQGPLTGCLLPLPGLGRFISGQFSSIVIEPARIFHPAPFVATPHTSAIGRTSPDRNHGTTTNPPMDIRVGASVLSPSGER